MPKLHPFDLLYFFVLLAELCFSQMPDLYSYHYISKSLLMPLLLLVWWHWSTGLPGFIRRGIIAALVFSWLGDVFLLFEGDGPLFFPAGLGAFLVAHLCYAGVFFRQGQKSIPYWPVCLPLLVFAGGVFYLSYPKLGPLMIPVIVYMLVILAMTTLAGGRIGQVSLRSFQWVLLGALLFVLSDSLIALNKFYRPIPREALWIMLTYGFGQWWMVRGLGKDSAQPG